MVYRLISILVGFAYISSNYTTKIREFKIRTRKDPVNTVSEYRNKRLQRFVGSKLNVHVALSV